MIDITQVLNACNREGIDIDRECLREYKEELKSTVNEKMYQIVDYGYTESTSDKHFVSEFMLATAQQYGSEIELLFNSPDGSLNLAPESIFVAFKCAKNVEFKEILNILYNLSYAEELLEEIEELEACINKNNTVMPNLSYVSNNIKYGAGNFISRVEFTKVIRLDKNMKALNTRGVLYFNFLASLGIPEKEIIRHKGTDSGVIIKELSYLEECSICDFLMDFNVKSNTEFAKYYLEGKKEFFDDKTKKRNRRKYINDFLEDISTIIESIENNEIKIRLLTRNLILFEQNVSKISKSLYDCIGQPISIVRGAKRIWENGGLYVFNWCTESELDKCNALQGYTGEFVDLNEVSKKVPAEEYVAILEKVKKASPVEIIKLKKINNTLDIYKNKMYRSEDLGLEPKVDGKNIYFVYSDINTIYRRYSVSDTNSLFSAVMVDFMNIGSEFGIEDNYYRLIVTDLILKLIFTDCDLNYVSHVPLDSRIERIYEDDKKLFFYATYDAESYIKKRKLFD